MIVSEQDSPAAREAGFTLVELILVVLVLAILGTALLIRSLSVTQVSAAVAADLAATEIRAVQSRAMFTGNPGSITFSGNSYTDDGRTRYLPGDASASTFSVAFNSFGEPAFDSGPSFQISSGETTRTITISNLTGQLTIE